METLPAGNLTAATLKFTGQSVYRGRHVRHGHKRTFAADALISVRCLEADSYTALVRTRPSWHVTCFSVGHGR
jgi:hypothetical protein